MLWDARRWPSLAPTLFAVDLEHRWMLLGDHGTAMREVLSPEGQVEALAELLPTYAQMQVSTVELLGGWMSEGVPDMRVEALPGLFGAFLGEWATEDDSLRAACEAALPALRAACQELAVTAVASTLDHGDIHGTNVLFDVRQPRLIDWGDCCVTHPYASLFVPFQFVVAGLPPPIRREAAARLRDVYLGPWGGPTVENVRAFNQATWIAPIIRVLALSNEEGGGDEIASLVGDWATDRPGDRA